MGLHVKLVFAAISFELALGRSVGLWPRRVNRISLGIPTRKSICSPIGTFRRCNLNAARTVNLLCLSAATNVGVRVVAAHIQEKATR
jgi:hypothetical protein